MSEKKRKLPSFFSALFPERCVYCRRVVISGDKVCSSCKKSLPRITGDICSHCGREKKVCSCGKKQNYFNSVVAPFYFTGVARKGLHQFKFRNHPESSDVFAGEMADTVKKRYSGINFDYIISVPMTKTSESERGFDQCGILAEKLSRLIDVPYCNDVVEKIYETRKQHGLNHILRTGNQLGAFEVNDPARVKDKTILLVDDISTSGETLNECSKMLWLSDAEAIYCVTVALTKSNKPKKNR